MQYSFFDGEMLGAYSFWQSDIWKNILTRSSQVQSARYFGDKNSLFALVEIRSIGLGQLGAFIIGGPCVVSSHADREGFFTALTQVLKKEKVLFLQYEPIDRDIGDIEGFHEGAFKVFLEPFTRTLDLTLSEEQLLKEMHEKGRYNIRYAQKKGLTLRTMNTKEGVMEFYKLLTSTTTRKGFSGNSLRYYQAFVDEISAHDRGNLYGVFFGEVCIAAGIFTWTDNRAIYYYGASTEDRELKKLMAPYLLQWHAICEAKSRGCLVYDFLGVANPENPYDRLAGVTVFKERFGGSLVELPKKYMQPLSRKYRLFLLAKKIKSLGK